MKLLFQWQSMVIVCHGVSAQTLLITRNSTQWCDAQLIYTYKVLYLSAYTLMHKHSEEANIIGCWLTRSIDECEPNLRFSEQTKFFPCKRIGSLKWLDISDYDIPTFRIYITFFGLLECVIVYSMKKHIRMCHKVKIEKIGHIIVWQIRIEIMHGLHLYQLPLIFAMLMWK